MTTTLFPLGRIVATPGALSLLAATATNPAELLYRHDAGDWGEVPPEDARENERSLKYDFRIVSSYLVGGPVRGFGSSPRPTGRAPACCRRSVEPLNIYPGL
jgi:hypothetical protein